MPKGLLRSGITAAFDQDLWQALQVMPGMQFEVDNTLRPALVTGLKKGDQGTPGIPAAITAEKDDDGNIVLLTKIVNADAHWLKLDGSNANQNIDIGVYSFNARNFFAAFDCTIGDDLRVGSTTAASQSYFRGTTFPVLEVARYTSTTNSLLATLKLVRGVRPGVGANGLGCGVWFYAEDSAGAENVMAMMGARWNSATHPNETGEFVFSPAKNNNDPFNDFPTLIVKATTPGGRYTITIDSDNILYASNGTFFFDNDHIETNGGHIANAKAKMTTLGGYAVKLTNRTGSPSVIGQLVKADTANNDAVDLTAAADDECIGVFLDSVATNAEAWIVVAGIADVALDDNVAAVRGNWMGTGAIGYARTQAVPPALGVAAHFEEIGHCIETVAAGGGGTHILARCVLHFN